MPQGSMNLPHHKNKDSSWHKYSLGVRRGSPLAFLEKMISGSVAMAECLHHKPSMERSKWESLRGMKVRREIMEERKECYKRWYRWSNPRVHSCMLRRSLLQLSFVEFFPFSMMFSVDLVCRSKVSFVFFCACSRLWSLSRKKFFFPCWNNYQRHRNVWTEHCWSSLFLFATACKNATPSWDWTTISINLFALVKNSGNSKLDNYP